MEATAETWIGGGVALLAIVGLIRWFFTDRSATAILHTEISELRKALADQSARHAREIAELDAKVNHITDQYDEQRSMKHKALNDVAKTVMALDLVQRLATECTCGVLAPLSEIVDRLVADLATYRQPEGFQP